MKTISLALLAVSCFREAPPCDSATLDRIKAECPTEEECYRQLEERESVCLERFRRGE
ncbi:MAG TPA: hypothetical protein VFZ53_10360 [Polyangiaceae bacterium]